MRHALPLWGWSVLSATVLSICSPDAEAQTLYGLDGSTGTAVEFNAPPAGPCPAPLPTLNAWPYVVPGPCLIAPPGPTGFPGPGSTGDIANDGQTDTIYLTDGFIIQQYSDAGPLGAPAGIPLNTVGVATPALAPILGMGMDDLGITTGAPTLYVTDGVFIWGLAVPAAPCAPAFVIVPPFPSPYPIGVGAVLTDVTVDASSGSLLACDSTGRIHSIFPGGAPGPYGIFGVAGPCFLGPYLDGIAMDSATTPAFTGAPPAFYVTDGFTVGYFDVTGAPAAPTIYTPVPCFPAPAPLNGLAHTSHANGYGAPATTTGILLNGFGQTTTPGPTFGVEVTLPSAGFLWMLVGTNLAAPGYFCPPLLVAGGNPLYVDIFSLGGQSLPLFAAPAGTTVLPLPVPGAVPPGLELYLQMFVNFGPGSWRASNPLQTAIANN